jgi:hypothetical protein
MNAESETVIQTEQGLVERLRFRGGVGRSNYGVPDARSAHPVDLKKGWIKRNGVEPTTTDRML